jgi:hypothetical protein
LPPLSQVCVIQFSNDVRVEQPLAAVEPEALQEVLKSMVRCSGSMPRCMPQLVIFRCHTSSKCSTSLSHKASLIRSRRSKVACRHAHHSGMPAQIKLRSSALLAVQALLCLLDAISGCIRA